MMTNMRQMGDSTAAKAFFFLLAGAFVLWGIGGSLMHVTSDAAITVNGQDISLNDVAQVYEQRRKMVDQMVGHAATPDEMQQLHLGDRVLAEVVNRTVLRQAAHNLGLVPATNQLREQIAGMQPFQDKQGRFSLEAYNQALAQAGLSVHRFESELTQDMGVQLMNQLVQVAPVSGEAVAPLAAMEKTQLGLETLTLTPAAAASGMPAPTPAQVAAFYKENPNLYRTPEKRSFTVVTLSTAELAKDISVPAGTVAAEYAKNKNSYLVPEERQVAHILFNDEASAKKGRAALKAAGDTAAAFAAEASKNSADPGSKANGGDLGVIHQSDVVPAFGDIAFGLPVDTVSDPVRSSFGWHLIRVSKITKAKEPTLAEMTPQIEQQLKLAEAGKALQDINKKVADGLAAGKPLDAVAQANGLHMQHQTLLSADANDLPAEVLQAAFATPQGGVSQPVPLNDNSAQPGSNLAAELSGGKAAGNGTTGSVAYVQVTEVVASGVPPLAKVQDAALKDTAKALVKQAMMAQAQKVITALRAPEGPTTLAQAAGTLFPGGSKPAVGTLSVKADEELPQWLQPYALGLMQLPTGAALSVPLQRDDNVVVARLASRTLGTPDGATLTSTAGSYREQVQKDMEELLIGQFTAKARVKYNEALLQQVFGKDYQVPGSAGKPVARAE